MSIPRVACCVAVVVAIAVSGRPASAQAVDTQVLQQIENRIRDYVRQRQQYEQQLVRALQQRNERLVQQYREQARKQAESYGEELRTMQEAGVTVEDVREMQRDAILAQVPRSQRSALERKWAREDRLRQRAVARAKAKGEPVPAESAPLDLGGLDGLKLD